MEQQAAGITEEPRSNATGEEGDKHIAHEAEQGQRHGDSIEREASGRQQRQQDAKEIKDETQ